MTKREPSPASRQARFSKPRTAPSQQRITVYVTAAEEAILEESARRAGQSLSSYLKSSGLRSQIVARGDWQRVASRLAIVEARLEALALLGEEQAEALDGMRIATALLALERAARGLAMPWQRAIAEAADHLDMDAFWPPERGEDAVAALDDEVSDLTSDEHDASKDDVPC